MSKKERIVARRLDFVRGYHGSHVRDYVRATEPSFVVGEYWDSLSYNGGLPDHNQVLAPAGASHSSSFSQNCLDLKRLGCTLLRMQKPDQALVNLLHGSHAMQIAVGSVLSTLPVILPCCITCYSLLSPCVHPGTAARPVLLGLTALQMCRTLTGSA